MSAVGACMDSARQVKACFRFVYNPCKGQMLLGLMHCAQMHLPFPWSCTKACQACSSQIDVISMHSSHVAGRPQAPPQCTSLASWHRTRPHTHGHPVHSFQLALAHNHTSDLLSTDAVHALPMMWCDSAMIVSLHCGS